VTAATAAEGTITYTVAPNETTEVRNGWIKLTLSKEGKDDIVKEIVVKQQANTPVQLVEGTVPNMNQKMFGVTFPDEFASLDATTFEGWVNAVNYSGAQANLPTFMGTENAFMVRFDGGKPEIVLGDPVTGGGEIKASSKTAMSTGEWHHIAAVYTRNAKVVLYVDGKKVAENNTKDYPVTYNSGVKPGTTDDAAIGRKFWVGNAYSTRWFNGSMSHLRVWSKALTNDEIVASANNRALETAEGLIANWPLTEDKGLKVTDLSGNGLNAEYKSAGNSGVTETTEPARTTGVELPTLEAPVHPTSITINAPATSVKATETLQLSATVLPENAWDKSVSWRSENAEIATVDQNGLVKGVYPGTVKIYAENTAENVSDSVEITVDYLYEPGTVTPDFSVNYNSVAINWGSNDVSALNKLTVEWKMNAKAWTNSYKYKYWNSEYNGTTKVNSVFGVEGKWLLRIGDSGIPNNQLELADHSARLGFDFQTDTWYAVAVTYDVESGKTEFYVNGELKGSFEGTATSAANLTDAYISQSYKDKSVNSRYFNGYLADVRVWNTIRSAEQIKSGINEFADQASENLLLYLKLDEGLAALVNSATASDATASFTAEAGWGVLRPEIEVTPDGTSATIEDLTPGDWSWN
ncbi:MAG: Ig-like domain-containing protein, partial [Bacteroidales bacterium]|nr:Ig-like domain-containing protein [Bacteroidales bacterium]